MIKKTELRIGNLIQLNPKKEWVYGDRENNLPDGIFTIKSISSDGINYSFFEEIFWHSFEDYSPISLTEEWAVKLGFEKGDTDGWKTYYRKRPLVLTHQRTGVISADGFDFRCKYNFYVYDITEKGIDFPVKYVHQLQNLYFAIRGEELTIK